MSARGTLEIFYEKHSNHRSSGIPLAVFDCDGTVIKGDIGEAMLYHQLEHFLFKRSPADVWPDYPERAELHGLYGSILGDLPAVRRKNPGFHAFGDRVLSWYFDQLAAKKTAKACGDIVKLFAGFTAGEVQQIAEETLRNELALPMGTRTVGRFHLPQGIRFIREAVDILQRLRELGFNIWAVSGSSQWSVEPVFRRLGVPADHVIGIGLEARDGVYIADVVTPIPVLEGKVEALRRRISTPPVLVVSDSPYDIPLLQYSSGLKLLMNSRNGTSTEFFREGAVVRDATWEVIESPTTEG